MEGHNIEYKQRLVCDDLLFQYALCKAGAFCTFFFKKIESTKEKRDCWFRCIRSVGAVSDIVSEPPPFRRPGSRLFV